MEIAKEYIELPEKILKSIDLANVFFSENYSKYIKNVNGRIWYLFDDFFVLPVCIFEKIKIKYATYPTEIYTYSNNTVGDKRKFLDQANDVLTREGISWVSSTASALFDVYPSYSKRIPFGSHIVDLSLSEEELWLKVHSKHRNIIRRAEKSGVSISKGGSELINDYIIIDKETWRRSGRVSYGELFFSSIIDNLQDNAMIYIAYKEGQPQAGACCFVSKSMAYYMFGASIDNPELGSANLLQWEIIKDLKQQGVKKYSFVGCRINEDEKSKYHGIQRFKERFGGILFQGYMFKSVLNNGKYWLFKMAWRIKNRQKMTDAIDQEIHKWPNLQCDSPKCPETVLVNR